MWTTSPGEFYQVGCQVRRVIILPASSDPVDGVLKIEEFINDKRITVQLVCAFRYGREEEETMGLNFKKELVVDETQLFPGTERPPPTPSRLQDRLLSKLGRDAFPFQLAFPTNSPTSVTLQPGTEAGEPCGVEYYVRAVVEQLDREKTCVNMTIRKIQFAPTRQGRQPSTTVRKDFLFSEGELELEATLDKQLYHHGDDIKVSFVVRNTSVKTVKKISVSLVQNIDIAMFSGGHAAPKIMQIETTEGCPIGPGASLHRQVVHLHVEGAYVQ